MSTAEKVNGGDFSKFVDQVVQHKEAGTAGEFLGLDDAYYFKVEKQAFQFYRNGHYDKALTLLEGLSDIQQKRPYTYLLLGDVYFQEKNYDMALPAYEKVLEFAPTNYHSLSRISEIQLREGKYQEAKQTLGKIIDDANAPGNLSLRAKMLLKTAERRSAE